MFCENCGSQNPDGLTKCAVCGAPLAEEKPEEKAGKFNFGKSKITGYAIIAAAVLVVLILLIVIFSGRSDKATLKKYVTAAYDLDAKTIVKLYPKAYIEAYAEEEDISRGDAREELAEMLQEALDAYDDYYEGVDFDEVKSISVEIRDEDSYSKKQVRQFNENFEDDYDEEIDAKEVKEVEIKVTGKYNGDKFNFRVGGIILVKVGGSWYIMDPNPSALFSSLSYEVD